MLKFVLHDTQDTLFKNEYTSYYSVLYDIFVLIKDLQHELLLYVYNESLLENTFTFSTKYNVTDNNNTYDLLNDYECFMKLYKDNTQKNLYYKSKIDKFFDDYKKELDELHAKEFFEGNINNNENENDKNKRNMEIQKRNEFMIFYEDKKYTYNKIYKVVYKNGKINFNDVPILFSLKFLIFLFMDGKDTNGNIVRDNLLDTDNDFDTYKLLYKSITDESFDCDNLTDNEQQLIYDFLNYLPNGYQMLTQEEIMNTYNTKNDDNVTKVIFEENENDIVEHENNFIGENDDNKENDDDNDE